MAEKFKVYTHCLELLESKINSLVSDIKSFQEASNNDTKSSAGDKFETNRAMMNLEKEKAAFQLDELQKMRETFLKIKPNAKHDKIQLGSFISCNLGKFYFSVGLGKIQVEEEQFMAISLASPLGKELLGKMVGDKIAFNGKEVEILDLR
jgi:transcription elongation GreA/GreB family factor